ncbi:hypothetical protein ACFWOT_09065 [Streptomyces sp. NPDC058440]|uniref:hypothetical protein n=1 Tax=Streptomyces sp. NPDC058440 TaxID=3346501 RepID=UPI0036653699
MRKLSFESPRKWLSVGPALRRSGRYLVCSYIDGSVTRGRTLSRRGAIKTFQHTAKKGW